MLFRRSKTRLQIVELAPPPDEGVRVIRPGDFDPSAAVARLSEFVTAATASIEGLAERVAALEDLVSALPSQADVLEVRLETSRVGADVARLATELRGEVAEIKDVHDGRRGDSQDRQAG